MIDLCKEHLLPLKELADILPRRNGKKIAFSTLWRWTSRGVRGVTLETIRLGATLYTSSEAAQRFAEALTSGKPTKTRTAKRRQQAADAAERELKNAGF